MKKIIKMAEELELGFDLNSLTRLDYIKNQLIEKHGVNVIVQIFSAEGEFYTEVEYVIDGQLTEISDECLHPTYLKAYKSGIKAALKHVKEINNG